jgi:hypothetical protein
MNGGVVPGTLVTTTRGAVPVEQVKVGDLVLTHRARWCAVSGLKSGYYDGEIVRLRPPGLFDTRFTSTLPAWCAEPNWSRLDAPGEWRFVQVNEVQPEFFLLYPVPKEWPEGAKSDVTTALFQGEEITLSDGGVCIRATLVDRLPHTGYVYNLQVEEDTSYVADGIAVQAATPAVLG